MRFISLFHAQPWQDPSARASLGRRDSVPRAASQSRFAARFTALAISAAAFSAAGLSHAQTKVDPDFAVQRFQPAAGPRNYLVTRGARTDGEKAWSLGGLVHYGYRPLTVRSCKAEEGGTCGATGAQDIKDVKVVENLLTADLLGSFTPVPRFQLGARVPLTWVKGQGIGADGQSDPDGLSAVGLGDVEVEGKVRAYGEVTSPFVLGVALNVSAPFGQLTAKDKYVGDATPTFGGRVILDGARGPFSYAVNLGGMYRGEAQVGRAMMGPEARYSAAAGFQVSPVFRGVVDAFGSTRFSSSSGENALEVALAAQLMPIGSPLVFTVGGGTGVARGVGAPNVRAMLGVMFINEKSDSDNDGLDDKADQCPTAAEDRDGYEDGDGCPDGDNDLDSMPDSADKCPMQAEDVDGFEDEDGCPELDNDKDGLADTADQCPIAAETKNNYKDEDGCPDEADVDNDGVPDARDKCPNEGEDTDGFDDTDGCPDPDNDSDTVLDDQDECIDEPETLNGYQDQDGCPDEDPKGGKRPQRPAPKKP